MTNQQKPMEKALMVLSGLSATEVAENGDVRNKFLTVNKSINGNGDAQNAYEVEKFHFTKRILEDPNLQQCTPISIYGAFIDLASQGLSVDPSKKLAYILWDHCNVGTKESPRWEKRAKLGIQARGEVAIRVKMGQIAGIENPVIVYEGDDYRKYTDKTNGKIMIEWEGKFQSHKIIGCFVRINLPNGGFDFKDIDLFKIQALKEASARKNNGKANALYTSVNGGIDPGFIETKTIKHAFSGYPKVNLKGAYMTPELNPAEEEEINFDLEPSNTSTQPLPAQNNQPPSPPQPKPAVTHETIMMTEQPSEPGEPVTVETDDYTNF